jgi:hypothetical protein
MQGKYTIDDVVKAVNLALPEGVKPLTKSLLQSSRSDGVGPSGNLQGQRDVKWSPYDAISAYHFMLLRSKGIARTEIKPHLDAISLKVKLNSIGKFAWLDIYKTADGETKPQFVDKPGTDLRTTSPERTFALLISINLVDSIRVMKEALSKVKV